MKKIFLGISIFFIIAFTIFTLKDEAIILEKENKIIEISDIEVERDKDKIVVKNFSDIGDSFKWNNSEKLYFQGRSKDEKRNYELDLSSLAIQTIKENVFDKYDYKYFKISKDKSKIAYYNEDKKQIETINLNNQKIKDIKYDIEENPNKYFKNENLELSDDGGYFYIIEDFGIVFENTFSIFGADSARLYANNIKGIKPTFSKDSNKIAFYYNKNMNKGYNSSKLGVFFTKNRKIIYFNTLGDDYQIFPNIMWSDDSKKIYYIGQSEKESREKKIKLLSIEMASDKVKSVVLPFDKKIETIESSVIIKNIIYIFYDNSKMIAYDIENNIFTEINDLKKIYDKKIFMEMDDGILIRVNDEIKYINGVESKFIYKVGGNVKIVLISDDFQKIAVIEKEHEGYNIIVVDMKN